MKEMKIYDSNNCCIYDSPCDYYINKEPIYAKGIFAHNYRGRGIFARGLRGNGPIETEDNEMIAHTKDNNIHLPIISSMRQITPFLEENEEMGEYKVKFHDGNKVEYEDTIRTFPSMLKIIENDKLRDIYKETLDAVENQLERGNGIHGFGMIHKDNTFYASPEKGKGVKKEKVGNNSPEAGGQVFQGLSYGSGPRRGLKGKGFKNNPIAKCPDVEVY